MEPNMLSQLSAVAQQHQGALQTAAAVPVGVPTAPQNMPGGPQVRTKRPYKKRKKTQEEYDALPPLQRSLRPRPPMNYVPLASDTKLYKPKKSSSEVWNTFRLHRDYPGWTLCLKCNNWLHYSGSTSTLRYHANDSCARANVTVSPQLLGPAPAGGSAANRASAGNTHFIIHTKTSQGTVSSTYGRTRLDKETLRQEGEFRLLEMISDAHFTQSQLSSPSFSAFCQVLNPTFSVPDRARIDQLTEHYYNAAATSALQFVQNAEVLALSADITVTSGGSPVHSLTLHTMTAEWNFKRFVVAIYPLVKDSPAFVLKDVVREFVNRCRGNPRLLSAVTEEAGKLLTGEMAVDASTTVSSALRGSCRLLHNVVSEALNLPAITPLLNRFRGVVAAVVANPHLARRIFALQHAEEQAKKPLLAERPVPNASDPEYEGRPLQYLEDASSRWLSTLQMLERMHTLRLPLLNAVAESKLEIKLPEDTDWVELAQLVTLLEPLSQAVIVLQNDLHSAAWPTMTVLHWVLTGKRPNAPDMPDWSTVSAAVNVVREHILRAIPAPDLPVRASHPSVLATMLDPRYKDLGFARDPNLENKANGLFMRVAKMEEDLPSLAPLPSNLTAAAVASAAANVPIPMPTGPNGKPDEKDPGKASYLMRLMQPPTMGKSQLEREIDQYRAWQIDTHAPFDCLTWWKTNQGQLPILSRLARKYLALPSTATFAEPLVKKVMPQFRVVLPSERTHAMLFIQQNRENIAPSARVAQAASQSAMTSATPIAPPPPPKNPVAVMES